MSSPRQSSARGGAESGWSANRRCYFRENTLVLEAANAAELRAWDVVKAVVDKLGSGRLLALRPRGRGEFEATLVDKKSTDELLDGVSVGGVDCVVRALDVSEVLVSFLHMPAYIPDEVVLEQLRRWGVQPIQPLRRRFYPGTDVADGTRFVRVRFPKTVSSLPFSARLMTVEGPQQIRVIHDRQVRLCRLCLQPGHMVKDCPDLICRECCEPGHFARECTAARCPSCRRALISCACLDQEEEVQRPSGPTDGEEGSGLVQSAADGVEACVGVGVEEQAAVCEGSSAVSGGVDRAVVEVEVGMEGLELVKDATGVEMEPAFRRDEVVDNIEVSPMAESGLKVSDISEDELCDIGVGVGGTVVGDGVEGDDVGGSGDMDEEEGGFVAVGKNRGRDLRAGKWKRRDALPSVPEDPKRQCRRRGKAGKTGVGGEGGRFDVLHDLSAD